MSKDIREYLHYYLGCEVAELPKGKHDGMLIDRMTSVNEGGSINVSNGYFMEPGKFKPILRKLDSLTEDEASDIYTIERDRILHPPTNDVDVRRVNNAWQIVRLDLLDTILWVTDEAIIYKVTEDNGKPMIEYTRNMPMIFHYLLSRGFWIFGNDWFDEGYIIDKATLK